MWIGKELKGTDPDKLDKIYALQQIGNDAVMTQYEVLCVLEHMCNNAVMT
jgi:hypothetical protein